MRRLSLPLASAILLGTFLTAPPASAQSPRRHVPLDHRDPPGRAAQWHAIGRPGVYGTPQPVRIDLPGGGTVTWFDGTSPAGTAAAAPAQAVLRVGLVHRVKVSGMPEFPGVELYPTIELLDRLHPPEGYADAFPIPVPITADEIELALQDRMVTKVIYLEQPSLAVPVTPERGLHTGELPAGANLIEAAFRLGRPMAILRIGGRVPTSGDSAELPVPGIPTAFPVRFSP